MNHLLIFEDFGVLTLEKNVPKDVALWNTCKTGLSQSMMFGLLHMQLVLPQKI
jgi:hypothetical protein